MHILVWNITKFFVLLFVCHTGFKPAFREPIECSLILKTHRLQQKKAVVIFLRTLNGMHKLFTIIYCSLKPSHREQKA